MTGAELLAQVRRQFEAYGDGHFVSALDGCVLLTAEEAESVRDGLSRAAHPAQLREWLALLTPTGKNET